MMVLVMDAQGGGFGKQLVTAIKRDFPDVEITAIGTNSVATGAMLKAGADHGATGENSVIVGARKADIRSESTRLNSSHHQVSRMPSSA